MILKMEEPRGGGGRKTEGGSKDGQTSRNRFLGTKINSSVVLTSTRDVVGRNGCVQGVSND